jgi:flagellar biosynthesis repressor protein FlbT
MSLKVELKPGERVIIGNAVITNGNQRTRLFVDGDAPILRQKDVLTAETADTPARRIYLAIQLMYLGDDIDAVRDDYFALVNEFAAAAPSTLGLIDAMNNEILTGAPYKALKLAKKLIDFEQGAIADATTGRSRVLADGEQDARPARS